MVYLKPFIIVISVFFYLHAYALKFTNQIEKAENVEKKYSYKIEYPQFKASGNKNIDNLNNLIIKTYQTLLLDFKNNVQRNSIKNYDNSAHMALSKPTSLNNLTIYYKIFLNQSKKISIRFTENYYYYGVAHPQQEFITINFDINNNKVMNLNDIFITNIDYIPILARICHDQLIQKLIADSDEKDPILEQQIENGTKPVAENFKIWNLTEDGMIWTFPPAQVAAYVYGSQEITISYKTLAAIINKEYVTKSN